MMTLDHQYTAELDHASFVDWQRHERETRYWEEMLGRKLLPKYRASQLIPTGEHVCAAIAYLKWQINAERRHQEATTEKGRVLWWGEYWKAQNALKEFSEVVIKHAKAHMEIAREQAIKEQQERIRELQRGTRWEEMTTFTMTVVSPST